MEMEDRDNRRPALERTVLPFLRRAAVGAESHPTSESGGGNEAMFEAGEARGFGVGCRRRSRLWLLGRR